MNGAGDVLQAKKKAEKYTEVNHMGATQTVFITLPLSQIHRTDVHFKPDLLSWGRRSFQYPLYRQWEF